MNYNSSKSLLMFPEYGRNVQEMIRVIKKEEDSVKRQNMANAIINLMGHLSPGLRNGTDIRPRLWKHFFAIAGYDIDVVSPDGVKYLAEEAEITPLPLSYPPSSESFRHYGNHVKKLIEKAVEMEDGPKKTYLISLIGSYMKMAYKTWNKDHFVSDEGIIKDLKSMAKNKLNIEDETSLDVLSKRSKNGGQNLQPQSSEPRPVKNNRFRSNRNNNNRRFNDRHRSGGSNTHRRSR